MNPRTVIPFRRASEEAPALSIAVFADGREAPIEIDFEIGGGGKLASAMTRETAAALHERLGEALRLAAKETP